jgi:glutathione S-transferase
LGAVLLRVEKEKQVSPNLTFDCSRGDIMKLYEFVISGNSHKVRMLLSFLGLDYQSVAIDLRAGEQKTAEFLKLNPLGQVPVMEDGGRVIWGSQAILIHVAGQYDPDRQWWPDDAVDQGEITQWLAFASHEMLSGCMTARAHIKFGRTTDLGLAQERARSALEILEARLSANDWLALGHPTLADIACYPYAALAGEGDIDVEPYKNVAKWFDRICALPNYISMPGLPGA